ASSKLNTGVQKSADPFGLYELLNKHKKIGVDDDADSPFPSHPVGKYKSKGQSSAKSQSTAE
ncbi:hypothetical protein Tco_0665759, partial [Tanacetum coccineum]